MRFFYVGKGVSVSFGKQKLEEYELKYKNVLFIYKMLR
jgi:hypothetical protein